MHRPLKKLITVLTWATLLAWIALGAVIWRDLR